MDNMKAEYGASHFAPMRTESFSALFSNGSTAFIRFLRRGVKMYFIKLFSSKMKKIYLLEAVKTQEYCRSRKRSGVSRRSNLNPALVVSG